MTVWNRPRPAHADTDSLGTVAGHTVDTVADLPANACSNSPFVELIDWAALRRLCGKTAEDLERTGKAFSGVLEHNLK
ncbi:hypothetical protein SMC26_13890 [Actinomadura fulvescens]|uniref:Uncharacterized protein n=1 Tax=Actinomadura fulvescens TaxID=46160 RepID=A0ABP6CI93_9ACTN